MVSIDMVVLDVRPRTFDGEKNVWSAERMDGVIIRVEPDNYEFWQYCGAYTLYTKKQYDEEI